MEVRVRDKRTGEEKLVPTKVYEALKHKFIKLGENAESEYVSKKKETSENVVPAHLQFRPNAVIEDGVELPIVNASDENEKESLSTEYEQISGKKPDGRWSVEKLKAKIEELKSAQ